MKRKKILICIDIDVIVRHFIANNTFSYLEDNFEVIYALNDDRSQLLTNKIINAKIPQNKIRETHIPRKRVGRWFLLYIVTLLRQQGKGAHYRARIRNEEKRIGKRNLFLAKLAGLPIFYEILRLIFIIKLGIYKDVEDLINSEKPDLIIHPSLLSGYFINELFRIKNKYKIPLFILMNSWDNPAGRAFCTGSPDKLVVWGEQTKRHAMQYMLLPENKIECFGAAQFEVYKSKPKQKREDLAKFFNVFHEKKIILYAGAGSSKYETEYLLKLEEYINNGELPNCQVIYRPHPWRGALAEGEKDFLSLNWKNIVMDPTMQEYYVSETRNPTGRFYLSDYQISNKILTLADAVISPLSTMLVESILKGKPVLAFSPEVAQQGYLSIDEIHFAEFLKLEEVNTCLKHKDFYDACKNLISQIGDKKLSAKLKKQSKFFVSDKSKPYGYQLNKLAKDYLKS